MINSNEPMSIPESGKYVEKGSDFSTFVKKFTKLSPSEALEFREKLEKLDLMKLKTEYIVKIIDIMPENQEDLNKIFVGISLDEDESKKILDTVKEFK